jgi:hypothetical protein
MSLGKTLKCSAFFLPFDYIELVLSGKGHNTFSLAPFFLFPFFLMQHAGDISSFFLFFFYENVIYGTQKGIF